MQAVAELERTRALRGQLVFSTSMPAASAERWVPEDAWLSARRSHALFIPIYFVDDNSLPGDNLHPDARRAWNFALDPETTARLRRVIAAHAEGAIEVHDLRVRIVGHRTFLECHVVVPGEMSLREAHAISDRVEAALLGDAEDLVATICIEPEEEARYRGVLVL